MIARISNTGVIVTFFTVLIFASSAIGEGFEVLGSIPSANGLYYTTMAPKGSYIAMGDQRSPGAGIDIIDVGDPANMTLAGTVQTGHMTYQLAWEGDFIYAPASWDGLFIYDVSDLNHIFPVFDTSFGEPISMIAIRNGIALMAGLDHLYSLDVSNPYNPEVLGIFGALACYEFVLGDSIAYAYRSYNDVILIDISNMEVPREISRFQLPNINSLCISPDENYLYLTCETDGLTIYDISDPELPRFVSQTPLPDDGWGIDVCVDEKQPNILFVSAYINGLWAVDVFDPWSPVPMHHHDPVLQDHFVMFYNEILYHTIYNELLAIDYVPAFSDIFDQDAGLPDQFGIISTYPNPFNGSTAIKYCLPSESEISLSIYNLLGQRVEKLFGGIQIAGEHSVTWDASAFPSGIYFARLETAGRTENIKMVLLK